MSAEIASDLRVLRYQVETLETENERMRERMTVLERFLFPAHLRCPAVWGLRPAEARMLVLLSKGGPVPHETMLYFLRDGYQTDGIVGHTLSVTVAALRDKMAPFGIEIKASRMGNYSLSPEDAERVRTLILEASTLFARHRADLAQGRLAE